MKTKLSANLIKLSEKMTKPLYLVGGIVRNYLIDKSISDDVDLCSPCSYEEIVPLIKDCGFKITATYKRTNTILFTDGQKNYEFTSFRKEEYDGTGSHTPISTEPTDNMIDDALRRDFKCNAIYYDIYKGEFIDLLGGMADIENKVLDTVQPGDKVFCSDGLRLLRLARFAGELNFKPTDEVMLSAKKYAINIEDISAERIYAELKMILLSDTKYPFSDKLGHYHGLKILDETRVLDHIIPELTEGRGMAQRADFHKYDVLEHSLRTVMYSDPQVRMGALFHDIGKPYCKIKYGEYHRHYLDGVFIAEKVLKRLKADNDTIREVKYLVKNHMYDIDCRTGEKKIRVYLVENQMMLDKLLMLKQADYRAGQDQDGICPTITKWEGIFEKMKNDGTPLDYHSLKIKAEHLKRMGFRGKEIGDTLKRLYELAVENPERNTKEKLIILAKNMINKTK